MAAARMDTPTISLLEPLHEWIRPMHPVRHSNSTKDAIASQLVGVWRLVSYTDEQEGGEDRFPFGPEPEGFLIYTHDRFVSAQLMKPGRSRFQSHDWDGGTPTSIMKPEWDTSRTAESTRWMRRMRQSPISPPLRWCQI